MHARRLNSGANARPLPQEDAGKRKRVRSCETFEKGARDLQASRPKEGCTEPIYRDAQAGEAGSDGSGRHSSVEALGQQASPWIESLRIHFGVTPSIGATPPHAPSFTCYHAPPVVCGRCKAPSLSLLLLELQDPIEEQTQ